VGSCEFRVAQAQRVNEESPYRIRAQPPPAKTSLKFVANRWPTVGAYVFASTVTWARTIPWLREVLRRVTECPDTFVVAPPAYSPLVLTVFTDTFDDGADGLLCGAGGHTMHWNGFRPVSTSVDLGVLWCFRDGVAVGCPGPGWLGSVMGAMVVGPLPPRVKKKPAPNRSTTNPPANAWFRRILSHARMSFVSSWP
jgi:hypothetical protein